MTQTTERALVEGFSSLAIYYWFLSDHLATSFSSRPLERDERTWERRLINAYYVVQTVSVLDLYSILMNIIIIYYGLRRING